MERIFMPTNPTPEEVLKIRIFSEVMEKVEKEYLPEKIKEAKLATWSEAEQWSNFMNSVSLLTVLIDKYNFTGDECIDLVQESNKIALDFNNGKVKMKHLVKHLNKNGILFDDADIKLARKYKSM